MLVASYVLIIFSFSGVGGAIDHIWFDTEDACIQASKLIHAQDSYIHLVCAKDYLP